jgi:hypothetical protein
MTEIKLLEEVIRTLQPVKIAVEAISREDANLFTADITFTVNIMRAKNHLKKTFSDTHLR